MKEKIKAFAVKYKTPLIIVGILILIGIIWYVNSGSGYSSGDAESLARCLKSKGAKFYGASWCPHCQNQKRMFGDASKYLPYIECADNAKKCQEAGVTGYPTWIFANGKKQSGEISLAQLKQLSSC